MENTAIERLSKLDKEKIASAISILNEAQKIIKNKMRDFFFNEDGTVKLTEAEVWEWVADRTIDEYKVGYQAAELLTKYGHLMEPGLINRIGQQVEEETRHHKMLYSILPVELQHKVKERMNDFPTVIQDAVRWKSLMQNKSNDYTSALFEISIVFEGFACAAIEPVLSLPYSRITKAYNVIFKDEQSHHQIGLDYIKQMCIDSSHVDKLLSVAEDALKRAADCKHYTW